jgi:hypothetical protein
MTCPHCKSENEMVFSVLSHALVCQEAECGLELELEWHDVAALIQLQPEEELAYA